MNKYDPMAQNQRTTVLKIVRNRNNVEDLMLKQRVQRYYKSMSVSVSALEQERLDVYDFYNQLHLCESDGQVEFKRLVEDIKANPPSNIRDGVPVILPLINTNITPATKDHPKINGAFALDTRNLKAAPPASLWTDPNLITLKDVTIKNISSKEKKPWSKIKSERCLQRLAATGWMDAILEIEARDKERQERLAKLDQNIEIVAYANRSEGGNEAEDIIMDNPIQQVLDDQHIKATEQMELLPTGTIPRMRSELVLPAAVDAEVRCENTKLRPSTTEKLRKKVSEIIGNPIPLPRQDCTPHREERETSCILPPIQQIVQLVQSDTKTTSKKKDYEPGILATTKSKKQREREKANEILKLILDRKAQKIGKKRCKKPSINDRMKEFYTQIEEVVPKKEESNQLKSILALLSSLE